MTTQDTTNKLASYGSLRKAPGLVEALKRLGDPIVEVKVHRFVLKHLGLVKTIGSMSNDDQRETMKNIYFEYLKSGINLRVPDEIKQHIRAVLKEKFSLVLSDTKLYRKAYGLGVYATKSRNGFTTKPRVTPETDFED